MSNVNCILPSEIGVASQDFIPNASIRGLSVKQGDLVKITNIYYEAINLTTNQKGFIPITHVVDEHTAETESWYFGNLNRLESEDLLKDHDCGTFLVRSGDGLCHKYTLSINANNNKTRHYKILYDQRRYYMQNGGDFKSMKSLIEFYRNKFDGITLDKDIKHPRWNPAFKLQDLRSKTKTEWKINRNDIQFKVEDTIGVSNFGEVYRGYWKNIIVAIKQVHNSCPRQHFIEEIEILKKLNHKNVITTYGICATDLEYLIVFEYITPGSLFEYKNKNKIAEKQKMHIAKEICEGMFYIQSKNIVHRNLSTRNVLINNYSVVKITDFHLSLNIGSNTDSNMCQTKRNNAYEWQAIECFDGIYEKASDVWSFGILMIELYIRNKKLYPPEIKSLQKYLHDGSRIPKPKNMTTEIYQIVFDCWNENPNLRPTFEKLFEIFKNKCNERL